MCCSVRCPQRITGVQITHSDALRTEVAEGNSGGRRVSEPHATAPFSLAELSSHTGVSIAGKRMTCFQSRGREFFARRRVPAAAKRRPMKVAAPMMMRRSGEDGVVAGSAFSQTFAGTKLIAVSIFCVS